MLVDDGSEDRTFELIREAAERDSRVVGVQLSRNFGHQAALTAALETVSGDVVVVMDGDLQDRPGGDSSASSPSTSTATTSCMHSERRGRRAWLSARVLHLLPVLNRLSELEVPWTPETSRFSRGGSSTS